MVRLKVGNVFDDLGNLISFQFLNGAIKSFLFFLARGLHAHFNSLMVRLKVVVRRSTTTVKLYFNSLMVRLKDSLHNLLPVHHSNFNSLMVRLKADSISNVFPVDCHFNSLMVRLKVN